MLITLTQKNLRTGESVIHGFQGDELIAALSTKKGTFRLGVAPDPGFDAARALVADWRARGDGIEVLI